MMQLKTISKKEIPSLQFRLFICVVWKATASTMTKHCARLDGFGPLNDTYI